MPHRTSPSAVRIRRRAVFSTQIESPVRPRDHAIALLDLSPQMSAEHRPSDHAASVAPAARPAPGATDYDAILAAVMETERGRWFLSEYASRNRRADTAEVLTAIDRLAARHAASVAARQPEERPHN